MCLICNVAGSVSIFSAKPVGSQALLLPVILAYCIGDILALIFVYSFFFIPVFFLLSNKIVFEWFFFLSSFKWKQTNERLCVQTNTTLKEIMSHTKSCSILIFFFCVRLFVHNRIIYYREYVYKMYTDIVRHII